VKRTALILLFRYKLEIIFHIEDDGEVLVNKAAKSNLKMIKIQM
jgi:hypothetical protein